MKRSLRWLGISLLAALAVSPLARAQIFDEETLREHLTSQRAKDAAATVVVYNSADRDSRELARFYAGRRGIPDGHVIGLRCPAEEEVSRADYDRDIAGPLRKAFVKNGWWDLHAGDHPLGRVEKSSIQYLALMRGMPLRIRQQDEPYPGDVIAGPAPIATRNEAAVDSELSVLGLFTPRISGAVVNPYYRSYTPIARGAMPSLLLVARLDGPTPGTVRRMIMDSLAAEEKGLHGFAYIDARGIADPGLKLGDDWLKHLADVALKKGNPVIFDNGELLFPDAYPMRHAALYFGWYAEHASGTFTRGGFRFVPGAVAVHIHSFSAVTVRSTTQNWCGPLVASGAAATMGNVYEPYLGLTQELDIFHDRLRAGFTFAESAYMAQRSLSWMTAVIGDPLYRPFQTDVNLKKPDMSDEWEAYAEGARTWFAKDRAAGAKILEKAIDRLKSGVVAEGLGLLQLSTGDARGSIKTLERAERLYRDPADRIRCTIHEVFQLAGIGRKQAALDLLRRQISRYSDYPAAEVLRGILNALDPPPPPPPAPAAASGR